MSAQQPPLAGLRVLEIAYEIAGPYAGKLLADAGADVVKVEPASGDPLRAWSATGAVRTGDGALFQFLNTSKRSILGSPGSPAVRELSHAADIVIVDESTPAETLDELRATCPGAVVSITAFGRTGPSRDRAATEFTLQAECGSTGSRGLKDASPLAAGGRLGEFIGGAYAAVAALAYGLRARAGSGGEFVDVSLLEAMAITMGGLSSVSAQISEANATAGRSLELPSIEPTADGYVGFCTITAQQFQDFLLLIERPDWLDDADLASFAGRQRRRKEFDAAVRAWTITRTTAEILELASALRIPVAPIGSPETVTSIDHFVERGVFVANPAGFVQPRPPYRISGSALRPFGAAPALGADEGRVTWSPRQRTASSSVATPPLDGVRVMDLTAFWAGPSATLVLAALGADVIKVEGVKRPDGIRYAGGWPPPAEGWWETGPIFLAVNENKRDLTLELTTPQGQQLALALAAECDVVIENFSPRVMTNLGLDYDAVSAANPSALMVRMPAFGLDGPWRDRVGFAQTMEQVSGMAWLTGEADGAPVIPRGACDPIAGLHAAFATLVALEHRRRSRVGALVEVTMVEAALNVAATGVIERSAYGHTLTREGNRGPAASPQGVYRCSGGDEWVAIATETDDQFHRLAALIDASFAADPELAGFTGRRAAADRIDAAISRWTATRTAVEAAEALQSQGIPASPVNLGRDLLDHPQLRHRGFFEEVDHPVVGQLAMPGQPMRLGSPGHRWITSAAPTLGEHNEAVLTGLLKVDGERVKQLAEDRVIGTRPAGL